MKIGIIGDTHFGFAAGTERESECFDQAREAFLKVLARKPDIIILPGDIFDSPLPRPEVLARAADVLTLPVLAETSGARFVGTIGKDRKEIKEEIALAGVPVVAIHGTHDRRPRGQTNPVKTLENLGLLVYLHGNGVVFEKGGERVAVFGVGGVPDSYASQVFRSLKLEPVKEAFNLFVFHQSISPYLYTGGPVLEAAELPEGFDLYVDGHLHWGFAEAKLLFTGSTVVTQQRKNETEAKKAWIVDTKNGIEAIGLESRPFVYREVNASGTPTEVRAAVEKTIEDVLKEAFSQKPLVKIVVKGKLADGFAGRDIQLATVAEKWKTAAILTIDKQLESEAAVPVESTNRSIREMMLELLHKRLADKKLKFDVEKLLHSLVEGEAAEAERLLEEGP